MLSKKSALAAVRECIDAHRWLCGAVPPSVSVSPEEYLELIAAFDPPPSEDVSGLRVMGVSIRVELGPYPWGSFPA